MHVDLFFDHYFNFLSVKTDKNKNGFNLLYPEESKAFKAQIPATCYVTSNFLDTRKHSRRNRVVLATTWCATRVGTRFMYLQERCLKCVRYTGYQDTDS